ncbi:MAG: endonuclease/exonuclease/phosphatase family protein, partial [Sedimenticola sp.]
MSDNARVRSACVQFLDCDIIGIAESHLRADSELTLDGYKWYGNNRKSVHLRARTGSGGVGFFVSNTCLGEFHVQVLDASKEGIFWIKLRNKNTNVCINACVCYLPPHGSSRQLDAHAFYDSLLSDIYIYRNSGTIMICGDFNSRVGDNDDFIVGVDDFSQRQVVDFNTNAYGDILIEFLINSNFCILNGRQSSKDDFTSVSTKGKAVVDYCLVSQSDISSFNNFVVTRASDLISSCSCLESVAPSSIPDHSALTWKVECGLFADRNEESQNVTGEFVKYDVSHMPSTFMQDALPVLNRVVGELETGLRTQNDIDGAYADMCTIIKQEMTDKLPKRCTKLYSGQSNKKRRVGKTWWSNDLTTAWNNVCDTEKKWLSSNGRSDKVASKARYIACRKTFDRMIQRAKRIYWFNFQNKLLNDVSTNPNDFWKTIGKVGVAHDKSTSIPMEVVLDDGSVVGDIETVLAKWKNDFSSLFSSGSRRTVNIQHDTHHPSNSSEPLFTDNISIEEVRGAIRNAKRGKACGVDGIPSEVLCNDAGVSYMHVFFNVCFSQSKLPTEWGKSIINPIPKSSTTDPRDPLSYRGISLTSCMYKLYCFILNKRLSTWAEINGKIVDEQNGFRKHRSTIDHLSSLTNIIDTR